MIKVVLFDFMGTCLDWHTSIIQALPASLSDDKKSTFALHYRQAYFDFNAKRLSEGQAVLDFDETQRRVLDSYLVQHSDTKHLFSSDVKAQLIAAWHHQSAWPEVSVALQRLKDNGLEIYVYANGSTRLQLDLVKFAGLRFDMLFSSELLGCYKPAPESYAKVMRLLQVEPEECVMVAAHAYDLRGAKAAGMKTVYIYRWTDDIREDQEIVREENDAYLLDMRDLSRVVAAL
ncbi:hypothetical protein BAUCODRAFT_35744 [Baudoinia panamericana UAMH 10762]|uniref:Haloacid dehalogenase, type II n=1 Tax=Baudoinia panamericana (strain UAMH 10762) TaxID=717646 RepID=M2N6X8_BAUPA|nr:uncharacterized protein BAUCODRAFT_35744 [Baudoinia panamericana UAMH 10762]EMC94525.1 hypothetical protein BAUCODRAFT_35744 [Baudoinia panamericana UAMH 10762]